jgi:hypothetical protein
MIPIPSIPPIIPAHSVAVAGIISVTCIYTISRINPGILPTTIPVAPEQHESRHNNSKYPCHNGY